MKPHVDVIIAGGGPAGSTAATLLARQGHRVLVVEKARFPRFHIGESLLPCVLPLLRTLDVPLDDGTILHKQGAEFIDERSGDFAFYDFADALPGGEPHAYQVERASFDGALLRIAESSGAEVHTGEKVLQVDPHPEHVEVSTDAARYRGRYFVDATGQDAMLGRRRKALAPCRAFGAAALFCHFHELSASALEVLRPQGNIKVLMLQDGWMWLIPLTGARLSVGMVSRTEKAHPDRLEQAIARSPLIQRLGAGARRGEVRTARNFSYRNRSAHAARQVCIGDAACFIDPVFSSGVSLAMLGAQYMTTLLHEALGRGREADPTLMRPLDAHMQVAYSSIGGLVHSFYHTHIVKNLFFAAHPNPEMRAGLISVLAGDVWRSDNRFQQMLLRSNRRGAAIFDDSAYEAESG